MKYMVHLHFLASNNVSEYEALVIDQVMKESSYHKPRWLCTTKSAS
jgi:hypothetical protein